MRVTWSGLHVGYVGEDIGYYDSDTDEVWTIPIPRASDD